MKVWIDFQNDGTQPEFPPVEVEVQAVPRVGEKVGIRPSEGQKPGIFYLDFVVDVRHYIAARTHEIRVLIATRP